MYQPNIPPHLEHLNLIAVRGTINATPLDLPSRFERVISDMQALGWQVWGPRVETDPGILPLPGSRQIEMMVRKRDVPYTEAEARADFAAVCSKHSMSLDLLESYAREINREIIAPTVQEFGAASSKALIIGGLGLLAWLAITRR